jgi:peptidyl-prolyl cis-trans isomerase SurA
MKTRVLVPTLLFLLAALVPGAPARAEEKTNDEASSRQLLEEIVARVNNEIITLSELRLSEETLRQEMMQQLRGAELERVFEEQRQNVLRDLIDQSLLVQRGQDRGVSVESDVIKRLDELRQSMNLGSMEELERAMAAQGVSIEDYKDRIRQQIITNIVIQHEVSGNVFVDAEKVRNYYLTHREEFVQPPQMKIRKGEAFDELAREYSDAPTGEGGGDMGYFDPEKLAPTIREAVEKLLVQGVADPLETREGWLILQLTERRTAGIPPFEEVESQIRNQLYMDEVQPALREFLGELRREAYVRVTQDGKPPQQPPASPRRLTDERHHRRRPGPARRPGDYLLLSRTHERDPQHPGRQALLGPAAHRPHRDGRGADVGRYRRGRAGVRAQRCGEGGGAGRVLSEPDATEAPSSAQGAGG